MILLQEEAAKLKHLNIQEPFHPQTSNQFPAVNLFSFLFMCTWPGNSYFTAYLSLSQEI